VRRGETFEGAADAVASTRVEAPRRASRQPKVLLASAPPPNRARVLDLGKKSCKWLVDTDAEAAAEAGAGAEASEDDDEEGEDDSE